MSDLENSSLVEYTGARRESVFLKRVYLWMSLGLILTAAVALITASIPGVVDFILQRPMTLLVVAILEIAVVMVLAMRIEKMKSSTAIVCFLLYSVLTGITFSILLVAYAGTTVIPKAFFSASSIFIAASIYGAFTKKAINRWTKWLFMGLIGLVIASVVNLLFSWSWLDFGISVFGVVIFTLLVMWDTKKLVAINASYGDMMLKSELTKISIMGALDLYLDFINIFMYLIRIFGRQRDR